MLSSGWLQAQITTGKLCHTSPDQSSWQRHKVFIGWEVTKTLFRIETSWSDQQAAVLTFKKSPILRTSKRKANLA